MEQKIHQLSLLERIEELKLEKKELKTIEDRNDTKKKYLMEKMRVLEKNKMENQNKNSEVAFLKIITKHNANILDFIKK